MNKINQFLKKDNIQRICYVALLICWAFIFIDTDLRAHITSYTDYLPLIFIIPVILLVLQILFNNRILWAIIFGCIVLYTLWTFLKLFTYIVVDQNRAYINAVEWNTETIFQLLCIILAFIGMNWFVLKIRPIKRDGRITSNQL